MKLFRKPKNMNLNTASDNNRVAWTTHGLRPVQTKYPWLFLNIMPRCMHPAAHHCRDSSTGFFDSLGKPGFYRHTLGLTCCNKFKRPVAKQEGQEAVQGAVAVQVGGSGWKGFVDGVKVNFAASILVCVCVCVLHSTIAAAMQ